MWFDMCLVLQAEQAHLEAKAKHQAGGRTETFGGVAKRPGAGADVGADVLVQGQACKNASPNPTVHPPLRPRLSVSPAGDPKKASLGAVQSSGGSDTSNDVRVHDC